MTSFDKFTVGLVAVIVMLLAAGCKTTTATLEQPTWYPYPKGIGFEGKIFFDFGAKYRTGLNKGNRHQGIDIQGHRNQPIVAIADGTVSVKHRDPCAGKTLVIDHGHDLNGERLFAHYVHLGGFTVESGQQVKRGDLIGWVIPPPRKTSCWPSQHLHLELANSVYLYNMEFRKQGKNPHLLWADGPWRPTCFEEGREYPEGTITYPILCDWQIHTIEDLLAIN